MADQEALDLEIAFQEAADENYREVEANFANLEGGQGGDGEIHNCLGGYEYEFVDGINDDQKCPVCLLPMKDPVQIESCGHRLCRECLNGILRSGNPVCPKDRQIINIDKVFSDKGFARGMLSLEVRCLQSDRGCLWVGQLRHAEEHIGECSYEDQNCLACDALVQRRHLEMHQNDSCPKRIIECAHCQDEYTFIEKQQHEEVYCRRFPLTCPNSCGKKEIPREELQSHLSEKCLMSEVTCPYAKAGCPFQDKRVHLIDHTEASVEDHVEMTYSLLLATEIECSARHDRITEWQQKFHESEENNQKLLQAVEDCHDRITEWQQKFHESEENNQKLLQAVDDYRKQVRDLNLETKRLGIKSIEQEKTIEEMLKKNYLKEKLSIKDMSGKIAQHEIMIEKLQQRNFRLERKIEEMARNNSRQEKTIKDTSQKIFEEQQKMMENSFRINPYLETSQEGQARKNPSQGMKRLSSYNTYQEDTDSDRNSCHETPPDNEFMTESVCGYMI